MVLPPSALLSNAKVTKNNVVPDHRELNLIAYASGTRNY
jgi:hypothetical protein